MRRVEESHRPLRAEPLMFAGYERWVLENSPRRADVSEDGAKRPLPTLRPVLGRSIFVEALTGTTRRRRRPLPAVL